MQRVAYLSGMMYYWATALGIFMNPVPAALLVWVKPSAVLWYNIAFAVPSILMSHVVMRVWCKQPYGWSALRQAAELRAPYAIGTSSWAAWCGCPPARAARERAF
jgi:hypothetical protein